MKSSLRLWVLAWGVAVLGLTSINASAEDIRVRCRVSDGRSKISIDGNNLASGQYTAKAVSGNNSAVSDPQDTIGDEVEFDFDSDPDDIAAGATPIAANFIQNNRVRGKIIDAQGDVVASATARCRR